MFLALDRSKNISHIRLQRTGHSTNDMKQRCERQASAALSPLSALSVNHAFIGSQDQVPLESIQVGLGDEVHHVEEVIVLILLLPCQGPLEPFMLGGGVIEHHIEHQTAPSLFCLDDELFFSTMTVDEQLARKSGFPIGAEVYCIHRVRYLNGQPLILDIDLFLRSLVPGLTAEIAEQSIYAYIEQELPSFSARPGRSPVSEIQTAALPCSGSDTQDIIRKLSRAQTAGSCSRRAL